MRYIFLVLMCALFAYGCISAKGKLSGTDVVTPYGTANSVNSELEINSND